MSWIAWIIVGLILIYVALCFRIVKENEKGVRLSKNKPIKALDSGWYWVWWPTESIDIFPKSPQKMDYPENLTITKTDTYKEEKIESAKITIDSTVYFNWGDGEDLIRATQNAPRPRSAEKMAEFIEDAVIDAIRGEVGKRTWKECTEEREKLVKSIEEILKESTVIENCGLKNVKVAITDIKLAKDLDETINQAEIARIGKLAELQKIEIETARIQKTAKAEAEKVELLAKAEAGKVELLAKAEAKKVELLAKAEAEKIRKVASALGIKKDSSQYFALVNYWKALETISAGESTKVIIPAELSNILGAIPAIQTLTEKKETG